MNYSRGGRGLTKPPPGSQIDWASGLCQGLKSLVAFNEGAGSPADLARPDRQALLATTGTVYPSWSANTEAGPGCGTTSDTTSYWNLGPNDLFVPANSVTVLLIMRKTDSTNRAAGHFGVDAAGVAQRCGVHCPFSDGTVYWDFGGQTSPNRITATSLTVSGVNAWAFVAGTRGSAIYQNGILRNSQATAIARGSNTTNFVLNRANGSAGDFCDYLFFALLEAEWDLGMVQDWTSDPYQMLQGRSHPTYFVPVAAAPNEPGAVPPPVLPPGPLVAGPWRGMPLQARRPLPYDYITEAIAPPAPLAFPGPDYSAVNSPVPGPWRRGRLPHARHHGRSGEEQTSQPASQSAITTPQNLHGPKSPVPGPWNSFLSIPPVHGRFPVTATPLPPVVRPPGSDPRVERVPLVAKDRERRMARAFDKLSVIVNSLFEQGFLAQTGVGEFRVLGGALTGEGAPDADTDKTVGAVVGGVYIDTLTNNVYVCASAAEGVAVWRGPV